MPDTTPTTPTAPPVTPAAPAAPAATPPPPAAPAPELDQATMAAYFDRGELPPGFSLFEAPEEAPGAPAATPPPPAAPAQEKPAPQEDPLARVLADLERRDRGLVERSQAIAQKERELAEALELRSLLAQDPLAALQRAGHDPFMLAGQYLEGGAKPPQQPPQPVELKTLAERLARAEAALAERDSREARAEEVNRIRSSIAEAGAATPLLAAMLAEGPGVLDDLFALGAAEVRRTGQLPDYSQIVREAEQNYFRSLTSSLPALTRVPSIKTALLAHLGQEPPPAKKPPAATAAQPGTQTLSATMSDEAGKADRELTDEERDALSLAILRGQVPARR